MCLYFIVVAINGQTFYVICDTLLNNKIKHQCENNALSSEYAYCAKQVFFVVSVLQGSKTKISKFLFDGNENLFIL